MYGDVIFMNLNICNREYPVEVIRKNNKNTYIRIKNNKIVITTNFWTTNSYINNLLKKNYGSIEKMIIKSEDHHSKEKKFSLFGTYYDIKFSSTVANVKISDGIIYAPDEKIFNKWLNHLITDIFAKHLEACYNLFEEKIPRPTLRIRSMKTRWGVCNIKTYKITLNYELYK